MYLMEALSVLVKDWQEKVETEPKTVPLDQVVRMLGGDIHHWIFPTLAPALAADMIMNRLENLGMLESAEEKASGYRNSMELRSKLNLRVFLMELREDAKAGQHLEEVGRQEVAAELPVGF